MHAGEVRALAVGGAFSPGTSVRPWVAVLVIVLAVAVTVGLVLAGIMIDPPPEVD